MQNPDSESSEDSFYIAPFDGHSIPSDFDGMGLERENSYENLVKREWEAQERRHLRPQNIEDLRLLPGYVDYSSDSEDSLTIRQRMMNDPDIIIPRPRAESSVEITLNNAARNEAENRNSDAWYGELLADLGTFVVDFWWVILIVMVVLWSRSSNTCQVINVFIVLE